MNKDKKKNKKRRYSRELESGYNFATKKRLTPGQKAYRHCFIENKKFIPPENYRKEKSFKVKKGAVDPLDRVTVKLENKTVSKETKEYMKPFLTWWVESSDRAAEEMRKNEEFWSEKCIGDSCYENNKYHDQFNEHKKVYTLHEMREKFNNLSFDVPGVINVSDSKGKYKGYYTYIGDDKYQFVKSDNTHRLQDNDLGDVEIRYV